MEYIHSSHSVYMLIYHMVFVVKYRRKVITDSMGDAMNVHASYLCSKMDCQLISLETDRDHMHLLVSMPPDMAPSKVVTVLKCQLSKMARHKYEEHIKKYL